MLDRHPLSDPADLSWCTSAKGGLGIPRERETPKPYMLRANSATRKKLIWSKKQGLLSKSEAASNLAAATAGVPSHTAPRRKGSLTCGRLCPHGTTQRTSLLQPGSNVFFLVFLPLYPDNEGAHGGNLFLSFCKCLPRPRWGSPSRCRGSAEVRLQPSPPARADAFPSWVASQQTCCCSWRRSRAAPVCRCYPSLPAGAGSGLWPHTDPGTWLISSQLEVKGCQRQGTAPKVRRSLQPGWQC